MSYVEYSSNNSGGNWWLTDDNWRSLEAAGWVVAWKTLGHLYDSEGAYVRDSRGVPVLLPHAELPPSKYPSFLDPDGRWLGALATTAYRPDLSIREAVAEFERITGADPLDAGCNCCGQPHNFTEYTDAGEWVASGPTPTGRCEW